MSGRPSLFYWGASPSRIVKSRSSRDDVARRQPRLLRRFGQAESTAITPSLTGRRNWGAISGLRTALRKRYSRGPAGEAGAGLSIVLHVAATDAPAPRLAILVAREGSCDVGGKDASEGTAVEVDGTAPIEIGKIKPLIDQGVATERGREGARTARLSHGKGKVILRVRDE